MSTPNKTDLISAFVLLERLYLNHSPIMYPEVMYDTLNWFGDLNDDGRRLEVIMNEIPSKQKLLMKSFADISLEFAKSIRYGSLGDYAPLEDATDFSGHEIYKHINLALKHVHSNTQAAYQRILDQEYLIISNRRIESGLLIGHMLPHAIPGATAYVIPLEIKTDAPGILLAAYNIAGKIRE
ncbi:MAG: hypothetical protein NDI94_05275 [Candidatus Woesearchaeota archaeon]|nr:hypothetical protein [Candidatus Woesearchaeota archaeon]